MSTLTLADFERDALETLSTYATIPCLSPMFDANWSENGHLDRAVELLSQWARARELASIDVSVHRLDGRTPMLCITVDATCNSKGTAVLYGHLDKQPPLGDWSEGLDPFLPVRRGDRVFARGIADDGYSMFAALLAIEAMERQGIPHTRCVVLIEASEESGSSDLDAYLDLLTEHLGQVELMICLDSGALTYDRLWVTNSLRGIVNIELEVRVLEQGQHSGSASGVVPSSFRILRQLIERVEDSATGTILVKELLCPIPEEHRLAAISIAQEFGDVIAHELPTLEGVTLMGDSAEDRILRRTWYPTLSLVGMGGIPDPAIAGNVLRPFTSAVLSFRLPPSVDAKVAAQALVRTLTSDVPSSAKVTCTAHAADGWVSPPLAPWLRLALDEASEQAFGRAAGFMGEGGSIPFLASLAKRYPGVQFVATGVLGPQSNAHGIDEMLDLPTVVGVTNSVISVLAAYAKLEGAS
jgi:acetylornithine deacetylase/succinyl-diaminopimelate desuccinylase-like protein